MRQLFECIAEEMFIDGHCHLMAKSGLNPCISPGGCVGFADLEFGKDTKEDVSNNSVQELKHIYSSLPDSVTSKPLYLLATALNINDLTKLYESFPEGTFSGFGELKLYDRFRSRRLPYKKISFLRSVCNYIEKHHLGNKPIYIHWALRKDDDVSGLAGVLADFPGQQIVLCHCGIDLGFMAEMYDDKKDVASWSWSQAVQLARTYTNLWLDVSWDALKFLDGNPMLITQAPADRIFLGTDTNPAKYKYKHPRYDDDYIYEAVARLSRYINSNGNIIRLFSA